MRLSFLQYPILVVLFVLCLGLCLATALCSKAGRVLMLLSCISGIAMCIACLVCFVPYEEILLLLLPLVLIVSPRKGGSA